jgi:adenylate cyclase class 2
MREIEVKILEIDWRRTARRLQRLGARKTFDGRMVAAYFDYPDARLKRSDCLLRLRKKGKASCEITYKRTLSKKRARVMAEYEVAVEDFEGMKKILESLGLREFARLAKRRISYRLDGVRFEIDLYPGLPPFLEIEATTAKIRRYAEKLGFSMAEAKPWSIRDVLKYYGKSEAI